MKKVLFTIIFLIAYSLFSHALEIQQQQAKYPFFASPTNHTPHLNLTKSQGFFVKLHSPPLAETLAAASHMPQKEHAIQQHRVALEKEHHLARLQIETFVGKGKIVREYYVVFNGFAVDMEKEQAELLLEKGVASEVYPNYYVQPLLDVSVPLIKADKVHQVDKGGNPCDGSSECLTGRGVKIAIIDTGVDYTHPDLGGCFGEGCKVAGGFDFVNNDTDPMDDHGHGTHVAATAAGKGVLLGVAPDSTIYAYKVIGASGWGTFADVIAAIEMAIDPNQDGDFSDRVDIISMSLGGLGNPDDPPSLAVDYASSIGVLSVIAAGNSGVFNSVMSPGTARSAITVGATNKWYPYPAIAYFSSQGPVLWSDKVLLKPDVIAPGVDICAAWPNLSSGWRRTCIDDSHILLSGTSMATPHVSGVAALIKQKEPQLTPQEIKLIIRMSAEDVGEIVTKQGFGFVNAHSAVFSPKLPIAQISQVIAHPTTKRLSIIGTAATDNSQSGKVKYLLCMAEGIAKRKSDAVCFFVSDQSVLNEHLLHDSDILLKLNDGYHTLYLQVYDEDGRMAEDMAIIYVNNINTKEIGNLGYLGGSSKYTVEGETHLTGFLGYVFEYAPAYGNKEWKTLCKRYKVQNISCEIDASQIEDGTYLLRLGILSDGVWLFDEPKSFVVVKDLHPVWPATVSLCFSPTLNHVFEDIDGEIGAELVVPSTSLCSVNHEEGLNIFKDGKYVGSINKFYARNGSTYSFNLGIIPPAIYQEDSQNYLLISLPEFFQPLGDPLHLIAHASGAIFKGPYYPQFPSPSIPFFSSFSRSFLLKTESMESEEIYSMLYNPYADTLDIVGFGLDGQIAFHTTVQKEDIANTYMYQSVTPQVGLLSEGDEKRIVALLGEGKLFYPSNTKLLFDIYAADGERLKRLLLFDSQDHTEQLYSTLPVIFADIDNDNQLEAIVSFNIASPSSAFFFKTKIYSIKASGEVFQLLDEDALLVDMAAANITGHSPSILFHLDSIEGTKLMALDSGGKVQFSTPLPPQIYPRTLLAADLNCDGLSEIVGTYWRRPHEGSPPSQDIIIYNHHGKVEQSFSVPSPVDISMDGPFMPALGDFNNDNILDISFTSLSYHSSYFFLFNQSFFVLSLGSNSTCARLDWPMMMHDYKYTSTYR